MKRKQSLVTKAVRKAAKRAVETLQGFRSYTHSSRDQGYESEQNKCLFRPVYVLGDATQIHTMMDSAVDTADQAEIGITKLGDVRNPESGVDGSILSRPTAYTELVDETLLDPVYRYRCRFDALESQHIIKNHDIHPCDITVYECVAKLDRAAQDLAHNLATNAIITDDILQGMLQSYTNDDTVSTTTNIYGEDIQVSNGATYINCWDVHYHPNRSAQFKAFWDITVQKSFRVPPGGEIHWNMKSGGFVWNPYRMLVEQSTGPVSVDPLILKGTTKVLLVKLCGVLGRSNNAADSAAVTKVGFLSAEMLLAHKVFARFLPYLVKEKVSIGANRVSKIDLTGLTLAGISEHVHADENAE